VAARPAGGERPDAHEAAGVAGTQPRRQPAAEQGDTEGAAIPHQATAPLSTPPGCLAGDADVRLVPWEAALQPSSAGSPILRDSFRALRLAWAGRTSTYDQQDPSLSLPRQLASSRDALPPGWVIVAHFYDIESGAARYEKRVPATSPTSTSHPS